MAKRRNDAQGLIDRLKSEVELQRELLEYYWHGAEVNRNGVRAFEKLLGEDLPKGKHGAKRRRQVANYVSRLVDRNVRCGATQVRLVWPDEDCPPLERTLGERLREKFRLRDVWVVNTLHIRRGQHSDDAEEDDRVHACLANAASTMLAALIRKGDAVGVGSGRALLNIGRAFGSSSHFPKCKAVCALTGSMNVKVWRDMSGTTTVDAEENAAALRSKLETTVDRDECALKASITDKSAEKLNRLKDNQDMTTIAVVGIGALGGRHQLRRVVEEDKFGTELASVKRELIELDKLSSECNRTRPDKSTPGKTFYDHMVSDICNWLFVNDPKRTGAEEIESPHLDQATSIVAAINDKFLNTPPNVLADIYERGAVVAIAGGRHKAAAIANVLLESCAKGRWKRPFVSHLVTDDLIANELLELPLVPPS